MANPLTPAWEKCFLCQVDKVNEQLKCPENDNKLKGCKNDEERKEKLKEAYTLVIENAFTLQELKSLPSDIVVTQIASNSNAVVSLMLQNIVYWHKKCKSNIDHQKVVRAQNLKRKSDANEESAKKLWSSDSTDCEVNKCVCFLCSLGGKKLYRASTFGIDSKVRTCADITCNEELAGKLSTGDMMAQDMLYHLECLVKLYRDAAACLAKENDVDYPEVVAKAQAFSELIEYLESLRGSKNVLSMGDIYHLYLSRLTSLGVSDVNIHRTRFRQQILDAIPDLTAVKNKSGRYDLIYDEDLSAVIAEYKTSTAKDMLMVAKAVRILRQASLKRKQTFTGKFSPSSQVDSVDPILLAFMQMYLDGPGIYEGMNKELNTKFQSRSVPLTLSQLLTYNVVNRRSSNPEAVPRHPKERETPVAIYNAAKVYLNTGQEELVNTLHKEGLCISIDRLRTISIDLSNSVIEFWEKIGVVAPHTMRHGAFTTGALDNFDHNLTSMTARSTYHGTGPSLTQHNVSDLLPPICSDILSESAVGKKKVSDLPAFYTNLPEVSLEKKESFYVPASPTNSPLVPDSPSLEQLLLGEYRWLEHAHQNLSQWISWGAYHASIAQSLTSAKAFSQMLPLFAELANTAAMVYHGMNVIRAAIAYLNPGQIPIMVVDQPLYTLAKKIQWKYPETHGEAVFVAMLGGLHIEKMLYQVLGDWLDGSGWTSILVTAGVAGSGTAQSFLSAAHITRTRYVHQVTSLALYTLARKAYVSDQAGATEENEASYDDWMRLKCQQQPQANFWKMTLDLELTVLEFVKACRIGDFKLYLDVQGHLMPWVFATDHIHYARNLPVHHRDMCMLRELHPEIYDEFCAGHFVVQKTNRPFSKMALDQNHEQLNDTLKSDGGVIGHTQNPATMCHKQTAGPELSRIIQEFNSSNGPEPDCHQERYKQFQESYKVRIVGYLFLQE